MKIFKNMIFEYMSLEFRRKFKSGTDLRIERKTGH